MKNKITKTATQHCMFNYTHISDRFLNHRRKNTHTRTHTQTQPTAVHVCNAPIQWNAGYNSFKMAIHTYTQHTYSERKRARSVLAYRIYDSSVCVYVRDCFICSGCRILCVLFVFAVCYYILAARITHTEYVETMKRKTKKN